MALLIQGSSTIEAQFRHRAPIQIPTPCGPVWQESREIDILPVGGAQLSPGPAVIMIYGIPRSITVGFTPDGAVFGRL